MSDPNERTIPINIYALQPSEDPEDPNFIALDKRWETWIGLEQWTVINNVMELKNLIIRKCGEKFYIRFLRIGGHGTELSFRLGSTIVDIKSLNNIKPILQEIIPYFKPGKSLVILDHCSVGHNESLLKSVSEAFGGIPVIAPFELQNTNAGDEGGAFLGAPLLEGAARVCSPSKCFTIEKPALAWGV